MNANKWTVSYPSPETAMMKNMVIVMLAYLLMVAMATPLIALQFNDDDCSDYQDGSVGQIGIKNTCSFPIYLRSVAGTAVGPVVELDIGMMYHEYYHGGEGATGVAIKMTKNSTDWSTPMLLEYAPNFEMDLIFYDMSISVGNQESGTGGIGNTYQLIPSEIDPSTSCVAVIRDNSYVHSGEGDYATKSCLISTSLTLQLC